MTPEDLETFKADYSDFLFVHFHVSDAVLFTIPKTTGLLNETHELGAFNWQVHQLGSLLEIHYK